MLRFRLNVLIKVLHAQELGNPWERRARWHLQCFFLVTNQRTWLLHACLEEKVCDRPVVVCMCIVAEEAEAC
jgi:hypothetical protein